MTEDRKRPEAGDSFREGVRAVTGILGALREAIEHSFDDMTDRSDVSGDKAKDAAKETINRAQDAMDKVRDRLDFATRKEVDELREEVAEIRRRLDSHQRSHSGSGGNDGSREQADGGAIPAGAGDGMPPL